VIELHCKIGGNFWGLQYALFYIVLFCILLVVRALSFLNNLDTSDKFGEFCHKKRRMTLHQEKFAKKYDAGWTLFEAGYSQKEIAKWLRVSETTVGKWARENDWKGKKARQIALEDNMVSQLKEIAAYQVDCFHRQMRERLNSEEWEPFPNGNFDGIQKVLSTIRRDFDNFKLNVHVLKRFAEYLQEQDLELAKKILPWVDLFLNEIHKKNNP